MARLYASLFPVARRPRHSPRRLGPARRWAVAAPLASEELPCFGEVEAMRFDKMEGSLNKSHEPQQARPLVESISQPLSSPAYN
jgi:hypothetical protein